MIWAPFNGTRVWSPVPTGVHGTSVRHMPVGYTGSAKSVTKKQTDALITWLRRLGATHLHHGDCIEGDAKAHWVARTLRLKVIIHPPSNPVKRAFLEGDVVRAPRGYVRRNHDIVEATRVLIAHPRGPEISRSGTWSTVRHARRLGRPIVIIHPDGSHDLENFKTEDMF